MPIEILAVRNAKQHVKSYTDERDSLTARHAEAMDCRNCEAFLQMGIEAFEWIVRADREIRLGIFRGEVAFDAQAEAAIIDLCKKWQGPVNMAEEWIAVQTKRGYDMDNLAEFRNCVKEMTAIIAAANDGEQVISPPVAKLRDDALEEHRNGQTAEFV